MKRIRIGLVCASRSVVETAKQIAEQKGIDIDGVAVGLDAAIPVAQRMEREGAEAILSRGGTLQLVREGVHVPVLSLPRSATDIMACLKEAIGYGNRILYISFREKISALNIIEDLLGCHLTQIICQDQADLERVFPACVKLYDVVIGGASTIIAAKKYGMPFVEAKTPDEVIVSTIEDAVSVITANREEQKKAVNFRCIIDSVSDGVISFDVAGNMTNINQRAKTLLNIDPNKDLRNQVGSIFRGSSLSHATDSEIPVLDRIEDLNGEKFVFSHVPIILNGETTGSVTTFKPISNVIKLESEVRKSLSKGFVAKQTFGDLIHRSRAMDELISRAKHFASSGSTILIIGETGTGKEILSQGIHHFSPRAQNPFVSINCAALSEQLLESELFGYEEGAFTGSKRGGKPGLFEISHTGTIFLDEISSTSQKVQRHLLRVLQEREVMRIGADRIIPVNVRVIAASNQDIAKEVANGSFREDLFFRLNILRLKVPPLRERREDIPLLIDHFIRRLARDHHGQPFRLPEKFLMKLQQYVWPGNVRQLQNFTERLYLLYGSRFDPKIFDELYADLVEFIPRLDQQEKAALDPGIWKQQVLMKKGLNEQEIIRKILVETGDNKSAAARKLGISRTTLWKKLKSGD